MSRIAEDRLLALIGRIYEAALQPQSWADFVDDLANLYAGTAAISSQGAYGVGACIHASSGLDPAFGRTYEEYYSRVRPWAGTVGTATPGQVFIPRWLVGDAKYECCEYYNDWLKPQGIHHLFSIPLDRERPLSTFLTISRSRKFGEFSAEELTLSRKLVPHLQRAVEMHRQLFAVTQQRDAVMQSLESLGVGAVLVTGDGRVRFANRLAERILARADGLSARHGRLEARTPAITASLHRLIGEAANTGAGLGEASGGVLALPRTEGDDLHVLVSPLPVGGGGWLGPAMPAALVFINEASGDFTLRPEHLTQLYGLTRAEAKLVSALVGGVSLDEYTELAGISLSTAKTHLQRIFSKTGWHRQSDVVRGTLQNSIARMAAMLMQIESGVGQDLEKESFDFQRRPDIPLNDGH